MSITLDRLQALRRQAGLADAAPACVPSTSHGEPHVARSTAQAVPADLHPVAPPTSVATLRRLLALRERAPTAFAPQPIARYPAQLDRGLAGEEIAAGLWKTETFAPQPVPSAPLSLAFAKRPNETVDPRRLLFFDTETTGLAGGTGTRAFMVGAADWHVTEDGREGLRVRQVTMASLAAEAAMLREFTSWLRPDTVLSSYNGR